MHPASDKISNKMNKICLDLTIFDTFQLVTPVFLLVNNFPYRFSAFSERNEGNLQIRSLKYMQNAPTDFVLFSLRLSVRRCLLKG